METLSRREFVHTAAAITLGGAARGQPPKADSPVKVPTRAVTPMPKHHMKMCIDGCHAPT
jgi:hypothetical protein